MVGIATPRRVVFSFRLNATRTSTTLVKSIVREHGGLRVTAP
jgi:hypothetical protein